MRQCCVTKWTNGGWKKREYLGVSPQICTWQQISGFSLQKTEPSVADYYSGQLPKSKQLEQQQSAVGRKNCAQSLCTKSGSKGLFAARTSNSRNHGSLERSPRKWGWEENMVVRREKAKPRKVHLLVGSIPFQSRSHQISIVLVWTPCLMHRCVISTMFGSYFSFFF